MRCAFLTMEDTSGWSIDADLAFEPLRELGWQPEWLPWRRTGIDWDDYRAVYLAATWDYPEAPDEFMRRLESIERSRAALVNPLSLVRWNLSKTYLRELEGRGVPIVPSQWHESMESLDLDAAFDAFDATRIIIKPVISTNANNTFLLDRPVNHSTCQKLRETFAARAFVAQPFMAAIQAEGEYSLFWIGERFSHAISKQPATGDFRVQEEHGASLHRRELSADLVEAGERVMAAVQPVPLYARCDFVRDGDGVLRVMELELIEPSLYLRLHDEAPGRFARAFDRYIRNGGQAES